MWKLLRQHRLYLNFMHTFIVTGDVQKVEPFLLTWKLLIFVVRGRWKFVLNSWFLVYLFFYKCCVCLLSKFIWMVLCHFFWERSKILIPSTLDLLIWNLQVWNSALELVNCIIQLFEGIKAFWKEQAVWLLYVSLSVEKHTIMKGMYAVDL